jgi:hypothetical protein
VWLVEALPVLACWWVVLVCSGFGTMLEKIALVFFI